MREKIKKLIIAKDDFPLEFIEGHPIINVFRRLLHASHRECHACYEKRKGIEVDATSPQNN